MRIRVLLPEPEGPITTSTSPGSTEIEILSKAKMPFEYDLVSFVALTMGGMTFINPFSQESFVVQGDVQ